MIAAIAAYQFWRSDVGSGVLAGLSLDACLRDWCYRMRWPVDPGRAVFGRAAVREYVGYAALRLAVLHAWPDIPGRSRKG